MTPNISLLMNHNFIDIMIANLRQNVLTLDQTANLIKLLTNLTRLKDSMLTWEDVKRLFHALESCKYKDFTIIYEDHDEKEHEQIIDDLSAALKNLLVCHYEVDETGTITSDKALEKL